METEDAAAEVAAEPPAELKGEKESTSSMDIQDQVTENNDEKAATEGESCDWLEPLEEDCDDADAERTDQDGAGDAELESLAGSECSGKNGGGRGGGGQRKRRTNFEANDDWEDCAILGQGWKRKEVFRRSGTSEGRSDTYYMSPAGQKLRSRVELLKYVDQSLDLSKFDFKSGKLLNDVKRRRVRRSSPYLNQKDGDNRTMSPHGSSPSVNPVTDATLTAQLRVEPAPVSANPAAPPWTDSMSGSSDVLVNGSSEPLIGICERCNKSFTADRGQTVCANCRKEFNTQIDRRRRPYRKWVPCGRCRACQITVDCGKCFGCRNDRILVQLHVRSQKVIKCWKRKCLYPVRKDKVAKVDLQMSEEHFSNTSSLDTVSLNTPSSYFKPSVSDFEESQSSLLQFSDSEDLSVFFTNDGDCCLDEVGAAKVRRRSCGKCRGCNRRTDCGTCDFCMDKPKFGGRNKKRQKCRLRQCQREAMKHLLPMDESQEEMDWVYRGRQRTRGRRRSKNLWDFDASYIEAEQYGKPKAQMVDRNNIFPNYNGKGYSHILNNSPLYSAQTFERADIPHNGLPTVRYTGSRFPPNYVEENFRQERKSQSPAYQQELHESRSSPSVSQTFSTADSATKAIDSDHELMPLLKSLQRAVLPVLWFCIVTEGPRLQLLQCSKHSAMTDTFVIIEPSFQYHISVQGQPLLPTHKLYHIHPARLTTAAEVVALLQDLERHSVCLGFHTTDSPSEPELVLPERAATCDFLISPESERCAKCSTKTTLQT